MRFASWVQQYGGLYRIRFFHAYGVIVTDPALVRAVLQVCVRVEGQAYLIQGCGVCACQALVVTPKLLHVGHLPISSWVKWCGSGCPPLCLNPRG